MKQIFYFLGFSTIFLLFSCSTEQVQTKSSQTQSVSNAKIWFENNPEQNNFNLLEFTDKIDWQKAKSFDNTDNTIIEVPIVLKQNISLTAYKSKASTNRLLFIKTNNDEYISYIINISSSKNNLDFINDLTKINYCNIPPNFTGNVLIIKNDNKSVTLNAIIDGKEKIKKGKTFSKIDEVSCYEIVELFDDGSIRHTGVVYCGGGGSGGTTYGSGGGVGGAGTQPTIDEQILNSNLDPCSKAILLEIINGKSIESIINQFAGTNSNFIWTLETKDQSTFMNTRNSAETSWLNGTANQYLTQIGLNYANSATRLSIARTIVHEAIHAYILSYLDSGSTTFNQNFPDLWNEMVAKKYGDLNTNGALNMYHHQEIARNYVNVISNALSVWDNNQHSSQYYNDLAWGGLFDTQIFKETTDLTNADRLRISSENNAEDKNTSSALGNPCN